MSEASPTGSGGTFAELFEQSVKSVKEGEVVRGTVLSVDEDHVQIDIGFKSEGLVPTWEFMDDDGTVLVGPGDTVDVLVEESEDHLGRIVLSKEKADRLLVWDEISRAYKADEPVEGTVLSRVKGGLAVDIGVKAFLPGSQVDLRPVRNLEQVVGNKLKFKIIKFNKRRGNIVLSRRALLETERRKLRETTLETLAPGQIIDGVIKNLTDYGAFIDLGGIDGLLHVTDMSWGRVNHPSELFHVGDEIKVKVLKFDSDSERVSLGLKQIQPDPWIDASIRYPIGKRIQGKVVSLAEYGAFVELEAGIEGLIHVSEMSWTKRVKHPSKVVSVGDQVEALVLDVDERERKISLGMKQIEENPWSMIEQTYPIGTRVTGTIRNITNFGIFVGLEEGIDGLVHGRGGGPQDRQGEREVLPGDQAARGEPVGGDPEALSRRRRGHGRDHAGSRIRRLRGARAGHRRPDLQLGPLQRACGGSRRRRRARSGGDRAGDEGRSPRAEDLAIDSSDDRQGAARCTQAPRGPAVAESGHDAGRSAGREARAQGRGGGREMTKSGLIEAVADRTPHISKKDTEIVVNTIFESMAQALKVGERIEIRGFGSFQVKVREAREGRNPKTGEPVHISAKRTPFFKVGKELKEMVDGVAPQPSSSNSGDDGSV
jgi:ribosomal protein S1/integration host factor beta subunit